MIKTPKIKTKIPEKLNGNFKSMLKFLSIEPSKVKKIPYTEETGFKAEVNESIFNVKLKTLKDGGEAVYGWYLLTLNRKIAVAIYCALWKSPNGELVDISPKEDGDKIIMFVPDVNRTPEILDYNQEDHKTLINTWSHLGFVNSKHAEGSDFPKEYWTFSMIATENKIRSL